MLLAQKLREPRQNAKEPLSLSDPSFLWTRRSPMTSQRPQCDILHGHDLPSSSTNGECEDRVFTSMFAPALGGRRRGHVASGEEKLFNRHATQTYVVGKTSCICTPSYRPDVVP